MANQIIEVPDIAVVKTISGTKQLLSLRDQKFIKEKALVDIGAGSGIKYKGDLYVLKSEKIVPEGELIATFTTRRVDFGFVLWPINDITVDWGDGVVNKNTFNHTYTDGAQSHDVRIYGDVDNVSDVNCGGEIVTSLDVSNIALLTYLTCHYNKLTSLDVSKNTKLQRLTCYTNQLTGLDVSNNTDLIHLHCADNPFITDQPALTLLANSLPDRTGKDAGRLQIQNTASAAWIKDICDAKNWTIV